MSYSIGTHIDFSGKPKERIMCHLREVGEHIVFVKVFSEEFKLAF